MSLMLLLTSVVCLSWGGLPLKKLISWCCVYVCRIVALHILPKVLVSEMWGSKHQCTVNLQLFTQGEMAGMFLALAVLQPNRDSALLLLKSIACYMKVMTLKNPYKNISDLQMLFTAEKLNVKLVLCASTWRITLSSFLGLITWMFIISWQILFFTEDLNQKIATRCPWWRCWGSEKVSAAISGLVGKE